MIVKRKKLTFCNSEWRTACRSSNLEPDGLFIAKPSLSSDMLYITTPDGSEPSRWSPIVGHTNKWNVHRFDIIQE